MKKFYIKTLGCKTNQFESQIMTQDLTDCGFIETQTLNEADFYILNSCSVTSRADSETFFLLKQAKRKKPDITTVLCGCVVQTHMNEKILNADVILGNHEKQNISKHLCMPTVSDIFAEKEFDFHILKNSNKTRVAIKIQDGCNNRCSYCTIPFARGNSRSCPVDKIILQINEIAKSTKEIVLTGIHIGQWGKEWNLSLLDLLKEIEKTPILRYRLGSLYVNEIDDELIKFLQQSKKFCPHFHLSLQSVCDKTLKNMNRNYSVDEIFKVVNKLKFDVSPFLGCDIIVGFPSETDEDFIETYKNLEKLNMSKIHVFPYSRRKGTAADKIKPQIMDKIKTKRAKALLELSKKLHTKFIKKNLSQPLEFLFEKKSKKTGLNVATSRNYIKAFFKDENDLQNQIRFCNLDDAEFIEN